MFKGPARFDGTVMTVATDSKLPVTPTQGVNQQEVKPFQTEDGKPVKA
jgi:hypothetical protein